MPRLNSDPKDFGTLRTTKILIFYCQTIKKAVNTQHLHKTNALSASPPLRTNNPQ